MAISVFSMFRFSWRHPTTAIKDALRIITYCRQRICRGYCDYDVGDIDIWFESVMPNMLRQLKEVQSGHPIELIDEYYQAHQQELECSAEEFSYTLSKDEELNRKVYEWCKVRWGEILEETARAIVTIYKARDSRCNVEKLEQYKDQAFSLLGTWYFCLWN